MLGTMGLLLVAAEALFFCIRRLRPFDSTRLWGPFLSCTVGRKAWLLMAVYAGVGLLVCCYVFISSLDGPDSFWGRFDNITHLNRVRSFVDSGAWSTIRSSNYLASNVEELASLGGFYPSAWHDVVCMVVPFANGQVALASNAVNAVFAGVVFPVSAFALNCVLLKRNRLAVICGAVVAVAFTAFPWGLFVKGPSFPNMAAIAVLPAALALIVAMTGRWTMGQRLRLSILIGAPSLVSLALLQPNALFALYLFAVPLLIKFGMLEGDTTGRRKVRCLCAAVVAIAGVSLWLLGSQLPFMSKVVRFNPTYDADAGFTQAFVETVSLSFMASAPQTVLSVVCLVGFIACLLDKKGWLLVPSGLFLVMYFITRTCESGLKFPITGYFYSDPWRMAAYAAVFLIPVASVGLALTAKALCRAWSLVSGRAVDARTQKQLVSCSFIVLVCFSALNFIPNYSVPKTGDAAVTSFGHLRKVMVAYYKQSENRVYSAEEQDFVREVIKSIPEGALVINQPNDGSVFAYGVNGLNTLYRSIDPSEEGETATVRKGIDRLATDSEVRSALSDMGATYILQLDQGVTLEDGYWLSQYNDARADQWKALDSVTDETPGLSLVLSEGDMRLYKIDDAYTTPMGGTETKHAS